MTHGEWQRRLPRLVCQGCGRERDLSNPLCERCRVRADIALRDAARAERRDLLTRLVCVEHNRERVCCGTCLGNKVSRARAEQREASAGLIYELAHSMAERGLFVRDGFGEPNILAIRELEAALRSHR